MYSLIIDLFKYIISYLTNFNIKKTFCRINRVRWKNYLDKPTNLSPLKDQEQKSTQPWQNLLEEPGGT